MNPLIDHYLAVLRKYAEFDGRATRSEFWWFYLATLLVNVGIALLDWILGTSLGLLYLLATLIPTLAVATRRLHDCDRSGWMQLLGLIPLIGMIVMAFMLAQPGQPVDNRYGPPPQA